MRTARYHSLRTTEPTVMMPRRRRLSHRNTYSPISMAYIAACCRAPSSSSIRLLKLLCYCLAAVTFLRLSLRMIVPFFTAGVFTAHGARVASGAAEGQQPSRCGSVDDFKHGEPFRHYVDSASSMQTGRQREGDIYYRGVSTGQVITVMRTYHFAILREFYARRRHTSMSPNASERQPRPRRIQGADFILCLRADCTYWRYASARDRAYRPSIAGFRLSGRGGQAIKTMPIYFALC